MVSNAGLMSSATRLLGTAGLLCLALFTFEAQAGVESMTVHTPRDFGYSVGDVFELNIDLNLSSPSELDLASLPEASRITRWLELREPQVETTRRLGGTRYHVTLTYQVVNAAFAVSGAGTPPVVLTVLQDGDRVPLLVESFGFTVMPVVSEEAAVEGASFKLQPAQPPPALPVAGSWWRIGAMAVGLLLVLSYLAYVYLALPWFARANGPFARALRELDGRRTDTDNAIRRLHHAFNTTAGHAVFAGELDRFFADNTAFERLRDDIVEFYEVSRTTFFARSNPDPAATSRGDRIADIDRLRVLCRACRDLERGVR